jgi:chorismate mutase
VKTKVDLSFSENNGNTTASLHAKDKVFLGISTCNSEDPFPPSYSIGARIAEARAYKHFYQDQINNKKNELKGVKRILYSFPKDHKDIKYIQHMYNAITKEIEELKLNIAECDHEIATAIESRALYVKSRRTNRKDRAEGQKKLQEAFDMLAKVGQKN